MNHDQNPNLSNNPQVSTNQTQGSIPATNQPISTTPFHKESEPVKTEPFLKASEVEPDLENELKQVGVESITEKPALNKEHEQIGVRHAKEATPVHTEPKGLVNLPIPVARAEEVVKTHKKVSESILWMAKTVVRQFKKGTVKKEEYGAGN